MAACEICNAKLTAFDTERCNCDECPIGREGFEVCPYCGGEGADEVHDPQWGDPYYARVVKCTECNGSGYVWDDPDAAKNDPMRHVEFPFADNH